MPLQNPELLDPTVGKLSQDAFFEWLFSSNLFQKPGGGWDMWNLPSAVNVPGMQQMQQDVPAASYGVTDKGTAAILGTPLFPSTQNTMLPDVFGAWNPGGGPGQDYIGNYLSNNLAGTPDANLQNIMRWGGTRDPNNILGTGTSGMRNMFQYGQPASYENMPYMANAAQFGQPASYENMPYMANAAQYGQPASYENMPYMANAAQFGVASQGSGQPLSDLAYGNEQGIAKYMLPFLQGRGNPYLPPPIPRRAPPALPVRRI